MIALSGNLTWYSFKSVICKSWLINILHKIVVLDLQGRNVGFIIFQYEFQPGSAVKSQLVSQQPCAWPGGPWPTSEHS